MKCYGHVQSMGTIILQACKKRYLSPNCEFMIHYGTAEDSNHSKNFIAFAKQEEKCLKKMEEIYLSRIKDKHPRFTIARLQEMIKWDKWITPKEAVNLGLADKII